MNGPEHYRRAETLLELASDSYNAAVDELDTESIARHQIAIGDGSAFIHAAQVHATLALAAATALAAPDYSLPVLDGNRWYEVAGTKPPEDVVEDEHLSDEVDDAPEPAEWPQ